MKIINKIQTDIRSHKEELIAQTNAFVFLYFAAFTTLQAPAGNNKYCNLIAAIFMLLAGLYCFIDCKSLINPYTVVFGCFTAYVFVTMLWSPMRYDTKTMGITLGKLLVVGTLLYNYLNSIRKKDYILSAFVVAGITVSLVTILYYGPSEYISSLKNGHRMGTELYAINQVGCILSVSSLIAIWFVFFRKKWWDILPAVLCLFVAIGTGSRAAILTFGVGFIVLIFLRVKGIYRLIVPVAFVALVFIGYKLLDLPVFGVLHDRLQSFLEVFKGGSTDSSTSIRIQMAKWGWEQFLKKPLFGIGFGAGLTVMQQHGSGLELFHNGYIEILVGCGIVGFVLYYFLLGYPLFKLAVPALKGNDSAVIAVVLVINCLAQCFFGDIQSDQSINVIICYLFLTVAEVNRKAVGEE